MISYLSLSYTALCSNSFDAHFAVFNL